MPTRFARPTPTRVTLLLVLLTATVLVAGRLAYEAQLAARAERVTAERALREYAAMAAWEFRTAARARLDVEVRRALGMVTAGLASTPFDAPIPLPDLAASAEGALPCGDDPGRDPRRTFARLDLRTGATGVLPADAPSGERGAATEAMARARSDLPVPASPWRLEYAAVDGADRMILVGVRYARMGVPLAVYAMTVCASAVERQIPSTIMRAHQLLPAVSTGRLPNDSLLAVRVLRPSGAEILHLGTVDGSQYQARTEWREASLLVEVVLRADAASRLSVGSPGRTNVPLLAGLLTLTAVLGAVALVQIRREHELARLRADFTSSVSHELRTPLALILLFGETLSLGRTRGPRESAVAAEVIVREARRLMHMVENILHFAHARRETPRLQLGAVSLARLLGDLTASFAPLATAVGCSLTLNVRDDPWVRGDDGALRQVVLNLLDNAVKYGGGGGQVQVESWCDGDEGFVRVDDAGAGVAASDRARIWLPYVRLSTVGRSTRGGSGLGLAVVAELCAAMHARAWVEDGPRGGAAFVIALQRARRDAPVRTVDAAAGANAAAS